MKKLLSLLLLAALLCSTLSCGVLDPTKAKEKTFTAGGMSVTLTEAFSESSQPGYTVCFTSPSIAVFGLREGFDLAENLSECTLEEYAKAVHEANAARNPEAIFTEDGMPCFEYSFKNEETSQTYRYLTVMYKASDAFWFMQFTCSESRYEQLRPTFFTYAKSVTFGA